MLRCRIGSRKCLCSCRVINRELDPSFGSRSSSATTTPLLGFLCSDEQLPGGGRGGSGLRAARFPARGEHPRRLPGAQLARTDHRHVQQQRGGQRGLRAGREPAAVQLPGHRGQSGPLKLQPGKSNTKPFIHQPFFRHTIQIKALPSKTRTFFLPKTSWSYEAIPD